RDLIVTGVQTCALPICGLTNQFEVLAIDLPGFGRSEARDDLFAPQKMGEFIAKAIDAFELTSVHAVHAVGLDVGAPSVLFAALRSEERRVGKECRSRGA